MSPVAFLVMLMFGNGVHAAGDIGSELHLEHAVLQDNVVLHCSVR